MQELREDKAAILRRNLAKVRRRIELACDRAGRDPADVTLVAVTKKQPAEVIPTLLEEGITAIGESRPEVMAKKADLLGDHIPWHMIGHYQRKKIKRTLGHFRLVHSVDSLSLLSTLDRAAADLAEDRGPVNILLQINVSGERQKQGFSLAEAGDAVALARAFNRLCLKGLMTMAPKTEDMGLVREVFRKLRFLRDDLECPDVLGLSMGMSQDYEVAIEEGATIVRLGSCLFDGMELES